MKWKKLGLIFSVNEINSWMSTHAMMPCVYHIKNDVYRIYFSTRDKKNRSRPASLDLNINNPFKISNLSSDPLLELGQRGAYDDSGVMPTCVVDINKNKYMFYNGWTLGKNIPFFSFNGVAKSKQNGEFEKIASYPNVLNRSEHEPYSTFAPFVLKDKNIWKMWYVSLIKWENANKHYYHIKYAESSNGLRWNPTGIVCIDFSSETEYAIGRPMVIKDDKYRMWFCSRALYDIESYRIRYAESTDGICWERKNDQVGIDVSKNGWDSEMICYPYVFDHKDERYMLYNGNQYGKSGFGLAVLER